MKNCLATVQAISNKGGYLDASHTFSTYFDPDLTVFTYRGSWCADGLKTSWEAYWRIVGERGSLVWDGFDAIRAETVDSGARDGLFDRTRAIEVPPLDPTDRVGGHLGVMQDFIAAVRGGPPPETAGGDNLKSLAMVFGAVESAEAGRPVDIAA